MPVQQIPNPFNYGGDSGTFGDSGGTVYIEAIAGGTITKGQVVKAAFSATTPFNPGTTGLTVVEATAAGTTIIGVAMQSAVQGGLVQVLVYGLTTALVTTTSAAVAVGDVLSAATGGAVATQATPAVGQNIGVALQANGSAAVQIAALICKF